MYVVECILKGGIIKHGSSCEQEHEGYISNVYVKLHACALEERENSFVF